MSGSHTIRVDWRFEGSPMGVAIRKRKSVTTMKRLLRLTGIALFTALSLFLIAFGVLYASVTNLLWFHAAAVPPTALEDVRPLYFALMKLIGGSAGALGLLGLYVTFFPLRRGSVLAPIALAAAYATAIAMAAFVAEKLAATTGAPTSWHIMGALLTLAAVGLFSSLGGRTNVAPRR